MKLILAAILAFTLLGCDSPPAKVQNGELVYLKDPKTGLCFAYLDAERNHAQFTWVPCKNSPTFKLATEQLEECLVK